MNCRENCVITVLKDMIALKNITCMCDYFWSFRCVLSLSEEPNYMERSLPNGTSASYIYIYIYPVTPDVLLPQSAILPKVSPDTVMGQTYILPVT
jgi:hypothetical protein